MKLIELNIIKKILKKLIPNNDSLYLADDFRRIEILFKGKKNIIKEKFYTNLLKYFAPYSIINILLDIKNKNRTLRIINLINDFFISSSDFNFVSKKTNKLSYKNKLRFYRLLIYLGYYRESNQLRFNFNYSNVFKSEDNEIFNLKERLVNLKSKKLNSSIAILGPLDDIQEYKKELNKYDHILIINPSNKFNFSNYKKSKFCFYYRTPSIDAIENSYFNPPKINPIFIVTEKRTNKYSIFNKFFSERINIINHKKLIKDRNLICKLNAIQSITLHLLQMGYRDIGIFGCDLFLTPRNINKREDYAPYQKIDNLKMKDVDQYNHFMCHEPYLNFIVLKILLERNLIKPYQTLKKILNFSYEEYLLELEKVIKNF